MTVIVFVLPMQPSQRSYSVVDYKYMLSAAVLNSEDSDFIDV